MKVKVIEAMALGVPVVTTAEGVEGLDAVDRVHAGISEHDQGLIERTIELLENPGLGDQRRIAGRALVEAVCSPSAVFDRLETVYQTILRNKI